MNAFSNEQHVVLAGASGRVLDQFLDASREHPCVVTLLTGAGRISEQQRASVDRVVEVDDLSDTDSVLAAVEQLHREVAVDYLLTMLESAVIPVAWVADKLGLRTPVSLELAESLRDKHRTRELVSHHPELAVKSMLCDDVDQAAKVAADFGYPVVVKPNAAAGSLAVRRADDEAALRLAFQAVHAVGQPVLIEEFLHGPEFSVETFSFAGRHEVMAVTAKFKLDNFVEIGHMVPGLEQAEHDRMAGYVAEFLTAIGLREGNAHTEVILTPAGPRIVESHCRPAADNIPWLMEMVSGVKLGECALLGALGIDSYARPGAQKFGGATYYWSAPAGRVVSVPDIPQELRDQCAQIHLPVEPGQIVAEVVHNFDRLGSVVVRAADGPSALEFARRLVTEHPVVVADAGQDPEAELARLRRYAGVSR